MAQSVPTTVPMQIVAGDSIQWQISLDDYLPADGWVLKYRLINALSKIDITAGASGSNHLVSVSAATSAGYAAGEYDYQAYVEGTGAKRYTVAAGRIKILPNLAGVATTYDNRTTAKKAFDAVNAWIGSRDLAVAEYEIAGRRMKYIPVSELITLRSKLRAEVNREDRAARIARGEQAGNKLLVRFGNGD